MAPVRGSPASGPMGRACGRHEPRPSTGFGRRTTAGWAAAGPSAAAGADHEHMLLGAKTFHLHLCIPFQLWQVIRRTSFLYKKINIIYQIPFLQTQHIRDNTPFHSIIIIIEWIYLALKYIKVHLSGTPRRTWSTVSKHFGSFPHLYSLVRYFFILYFFLLLGWSL